MATDTERLILSLEAQYRRLQRDMDKANGIAATQTRKIEARFVQTNASIARSSAAMSRQVAASYASAAKSAMASTASLKQALLGSASAIAASFGAQEVANLADSYTRFTNQLTVAGLEGAKLARTQEDLFNVANKYGVQLENLGRLYGGLSVLQKDLNTTSRDSLNLTSAVAASIKIGGESSEKAAGAILGLNQALAQTRVQSDEYNQILDGARPLLLAAVQASEKYGGSLAKLKQDIEAGKVSGAELFQILKAGFPTIAKQAEKATLTISNSFVILNNALGKYIGETDKSLSATQRLSGGIVGLANNLDKIVPALTVIIGFIGLRYAVAAGTFVVAETGRTAALVRSTLATEAAAAANAQFVATGRLATVTAVQMAASVTGTSVAMGVAAAGARTVGGALLGAFGGPVGLAIIGITAAIGGLIVMENNATRATAEYTNEAAAVDRALRGYEDAAIAAATATGEQAKKAREAAATARAEAVEHRNAAQAKLDSARASLALLQAEAARAKNTIDEFGGEGSVPSTGGQLRLNSLRQKREQANIAVIQKAVDDATKSIASSDRILGAKPPPLPPVTPPKETKEARAARLKAEREARKAETDRVATVRDDKAFDVMLRQAQQRLVDAKVESADVEAERLRLQIEGLEAERVLRNKEIAAEGPNGTKRFTSQEVERLQRLNDQATEQEKLNLQIANQAKAQKAQVDAAADAIAGQIELLGYQRDTATTAAERFAIERRLLALAQQEERARLQAVIASKDPAVSPADRDSARRRLEVLPQIEKAQVDALARDQRNTLKDSLLGALQAARGGADDFADYLGNAVETKLMDALAGGLADLLLGTGGAEGGGLLKQLGSTLLGALKIPGFAAGTSFAPGGLAMVHKNELINLPKGSKVNTAAQTRAMLQGGMARSRGGAGTTIVADFSGAVVTQDLIDSFNGMVQSAEARATIQGARLGQARTTRALQKSASRRIGL